MRSNENIILFPIITLVIIGLIMVFSSSGVYASHKFGSVYYFFKRQLFFVLLGLTVMFCVSRIPVTFFYKTRYIWLFIGLTLIILTLTPLGKRVGGASRWLNILGFSIQPVEFVKVILVLYFAWFFGEKQANIKKFSIGFLPPVIVTVIFASLLILQPDFGGAVFICSLFFFMSILGGTRFLYWITSLMLLVGSAIIMIVSSPYRLKRWNAFLHPFKHAKEEGYQIVQSIYALAHGGLKGVGIGAGKEKLFYLPEAHTDFVLSVVGEEMGFWGISLIFLCYLFVLIIGTKWAISANDLKDKFLIIGITFIILFSAILNMAVVTGMIPPKGLVLPFISYGGSNITATLFSIGLMMSIVRKSSRR